MLLGFSGTPHWLNSWKPEGREAGDAGRAGQPPRAQTGVKKGREWVWRGKGKMFIQVII